MAFCILILKNPVRTVKNISENIALVKQITGGKKVPLLIYLNKSPVPDKETRQYSTEQLPNVYTAMAMVSKGGLAKFIVQISEASHTYEIFFK